MLNHEIKKTDLVNKLKTLPKLPGVYIMKNTTGEVIYVGKAKNLKNRVKTYFQGGDGRYQLNSLMRQFASIETIITENERQALILESDLIKQYQPHYNIKLKDGKAYIVIRVDLNNQWPRLEVFRQAQNDGAKYFGPYAFSYEIKTLLEVINQTLMLRTCSDKIMYNRVRPCLEYQIKRCCAPCCDRVSEQEYRSWVERAMLILDGKTQDVIQQLEALMLKASAEQHFETAAKYRDSIEVIKKMNTTQTNYSVSFRSRDVFGFYREGDQAEISILKLRNGRIKDVQSYGFKDLVMNDDELLGEVLSQYYGRSESLLPEIVLLPFNLKDREVREIVLNDNLDHGKTQEIPKIKISNPKRGENVKLLNLAADNAKENYLARFSGTNQDKILESLRRAFQLSDLPHMIECIDISHFQGADTVASVVFFRGAKPDKSRYRRFKLSAEIEGKPDDFGAMREVIRRHLSRCAEENTLADLMIIDGGPTQLAQGLAIKKELGLDKPEMVGLAKKREGQHKLFRPLSALEEKLLFHKNQDLLFSQRTELKQNRTIKPERVFIAGVAEPVILNPRSAEEYLIEQIRDEAHRFAIAFHRKLRSEHITRSQLSQIQGIGLRRQKALLKEFGSLKTIKSATAAEISTRCKIPMKLAELIVKKLG
ncbi:MAG: excinuclease ABC subunit UvrC [Deltaproteobacteria bacterium]|jgi:excinuclease ABC subunit C|nr:excinuclease ABC subunit UvrC [Deltaproteobacteria bacterium]